MKERTCIICKTKGSQEDFFRIGKASDGSLFIGKGGRGAYICRNRKCLDKAMAKPKISFFLRTSQNISNERCIIASLIENLVQDE